MSPYINKQAVVRKPHTEVVSNIIKCALIGSPADARDRLRIYVCIVIDYSDLQLSALKCIVMTFQSDHWGQTQGSIVC